MASASVFRLLCTQCLLVVLVVFRVCFVSTSIFRQSVYHVLIVVLPFFRVWPVSRTFVSLLYYVLNFSLLSWSSSECGLPVLRSFASLSIMYYMLCSCPGRLQSVVGWPVPRSFVSLSTMYSVPSRCPGRLQSVVCQYLDLSSVCLLCTELLLVVLVLALM